ncbi:ferrochelatase, mitochondrial-like [Teleopsis dalmanni]|uniref:ferrochelatase, mitochondrial-like n=1 Tax=Teleopsis dalmanni TaxID=139649 RepID=UPI0018CF1377|nr:ferrochelatase, mitochondrial-like [Teleopsis dalmanni]XP_037945814.1 ferrochelatase, mitochondrial-like [Teleopsis dalmanni]
MFSLKRFCTNATRVGCLNFSSAVEKPKTAVLMLNMGGPQSIDQVHDYLLRIMTDRDMIQLPVQSKLGPWIAQRRTPDVQKKYTQIGGGSPILKWTKLQGGLMCKELDKMSPETAPHKHYVGFRYVNPLTENTLQEIERDGPERVVLFSQYPQYSCATSGSSFNSIFHHYRENTFPKNIKWSVIDRWATHPLLIKTFADRIREELSKFVETKRDNVVILFTAHSLPLKAVNRGDSYPSEIGATVHLVMQELGKTNPYSLAWQSKVGPLPWLAPATDDAIKGYVRQGLKNFILVPIAFVNEHIETLHELDIEYCDELAKEVGVEEMRRAAAPNDHPLFIKALSSIVADHLKSKEPINSKFLMRCPMCVNSRCRDSKRWYRQVCTL